VRTGIHSTFRFCDSGSSTATSDPPDNLWWSGPLRILANHFDGAPRHNIELRQHH
jgi:hypothetical protein